MTRQKYNHFPLATYKEIAMKTSSPKLTIIVPTYTMDRYHDVTELLDSLNAQNYQPIEIIIVVERSQKLKNKIKEYIAKKNYRGMQVIFRAGPRGVSYSRNMAIQRSTGDIIAFIDDDAIAYPDWTEELMKTYRDSSVIGVTGPIIPIWGNKSMAWIPKEFYWIVSCTFLDINEITEVRNGFGANLSFRREAFDIGGLLDTSLGVRGHGRKGWREPGAEEPEFSLRVRRKTSKKIVFNPDVKVKHKVYKYRMTTEFIIKRAYWEGYAKALLQHRYASHKDKGRTIQTEWSLLKQIILRLLPRTLIRLFYRPIISSRRLVLIITVLSCAGVGYLRYKLSLITGHK